MIAGFDVGFDMVSITAGLGLEPKISEDSRSWSRKNYQVLVSVLLSK